MTRTEDLHSLTGAYALHALPDDERTAFERHLAHCGTCEQETLELASAAARLGLATTVTPGPELKDRVLRRITTVRRIFAGNMKRGAQESAGRAGQTHAGPGPAGRGGAVAARRTAHRPGPSGDRCARGTEPLRRPAAAGPAR